MSSAHNPSDDLDPDNMLIQAGDAEAVDAEEVAEEYEDHLRIEAMLVRTDHAESGCGPIVAKQEASNDDPIADGDSDLADLDTLFKQIMTEANTEAQAKKAKERLKRGGQTAIEVAADMALVQKWEAMHLWLPKATVAAFIAYHCKCCGATNRVFTGLMEKQLSRQDATTKRWVAVGRADPNLPREIGTRGESVAMCEQCLLVNWGCAMPSQEEWK